MKSLPSQQGFTLVEMLIALGLGALLMAGLASSMGAITRSQSLAQDYEQVQETLRFTTSLMSRSLRTAEELVNITGVAETTANQFSVLRQNTSDRYSCNGDQPTGPFYETYYRVAASNQLVCLVTAEDGGTYDWEGSEILARGISGFSLTCLEYDASGEQVAADYEACTGVTHSSVIALDLSLSFAASYFNELDAYPNHGFVATLRSRLRECSQNGC
ncbi:PilW family protein [Marinospirillum perlucidum]|uniref:PilW family protein n=1 Tax=Marinospirillum perlucidum TaxID=1982602 RepID=UPI000DF3BF56|nr:prepilin-type N-terminal cleavage/methylation domain-containing protein [Marinospirillum perlucidum]